MIPLFNDSSVKQQCDQAEFHPEFFFFISNICYFRKRLEIAIIRTDDVLTGCRYTRQSLAPPNMARHHECLIV